MCCNFCICFFRLEVTVYDLKGSKIHLVEPDDGSFDSIDPFCPLPIFCSTFYGWVSHVTPTTIFVQPSGVESLLSQILDQLFEHFDGTILETPIVPQVEGHYIVHSSDSNWYRAKIVSIDDGEAVVMYVDYGNTEKVALSEIREMEHKFMDLHMFAIEVCVVWIDDEFKIKRL